MTGLTLQRLFAEHPISELGLRLPLYQHKAFDAVKDCRTARYGSHAQYCEHGHLCAVHYNSCRHRGCPQCQYLAREQWLQRWSGRLLDTRHHHWVFTLPHELLPIWRYNREWFLDTLFRTVQQTLKQLAKDLAHLGAELGFILAIHTWGRNLSEHPHIHALITDGGLTQDGAWKRPKRQRLFPAEVVKRLFRGKFLCALRLAVDAEQLVLPKERTERQWLNEFNRLGRIKWQLFSDKPYAHGQGAVKYLARYMRGGAIRNTQLLDEKAGLVRFRYRSHQSKQNERRQLPVSEFVRLFLCHQPLPGRPTVRYYGLYHPSQMPQLNQVRRHLGQRPYQPAATLDWLALLEHSGYVLECPVCGSNVLNQNKKLKR